MTDPTGKEIREKITELVKSRSGVITVQIVMDSLQFPPHYWQRTYMILQELCIPLYGREPILDKLPRQGREARYQRKEKT